MKDSVLENGLVVEWYVCIIRSENLLWNATFHSTVLIAIATCTRLACIHGSEH